MTEASNVSDDVIAETYANIHLDTMAAGIVSAYVSHNSVPASELPALIASVRTALATPIHAVEGPAVAAVEKPTAAQIRKSIQPDYIECFEDGKRFKSLKRHLRTRYGMTPEAYRAKWGLSPDYPMVAPNYSEARSALAKTMGLGQQRAAAKQTKPDETVSDKPAPKKRQKAPAPSE